MQYLWVKAAPFVRKKFLSAMSVSQVWWICAPRADQYSARDRAGLTSSKSRSRGVFFSCFSRMLQAKRMLLSARKHVSVHSSLWCSEFGDKDHPRQIRRHRASALALGSAEKGASAGGLFANGQGSASFDVEHSLYLPALRHFPSFSALSTFQNARSEWH